MASDDPMILQFESSLQGENIQNDHHHHHGNDDPHPQSLSRLSVCTNSTVCGVDEEEEDDEVDVDYGMARYMSGLSIESFFFEGDDDDDGDGELSEHAAAAAAATGSTTLSDSEENELMSCRHPWPRRNPTPVFLKEYYASDGEGKKGSVLMREETKEKDDTWKRKCRRMRKDNKKKKEEKVTTGTGLRFDMELEIPSLSNSAFEFETSSGATSPIATWRISSPGDDPRDVKARLKMWAQAVAASASASKYGTI